MGYKETELFELTKSYSTRKTQELEELFWVEIRKVPTSSLPVRGVDLEDFWKGFRKKLVRKILDNRDLGTVTIEIIFSQALFEIEKLGIDLTAFRVPVAVLIALVASSIWDQLEDDTGKSD